MKSKNQIIFFLVYILCRPISFVRNFTFDTPYITKYMRPLAICYCVKKTFTPVVNKLSDILDV